MVNRTYCLVVLLFILCACGRKKSNLFIWFDHVDGLCVGAAVSSRGVEIGKVTNLDLVKDGVLVNIEVNGKYKVPVGSAFRLMNENPVQDKLSIQVVFADSDRYYTSSDTIFMHNAAVDRGNKVSPVTLDSVSQRKMIDVFEKIDTIIDALRMKK